MKDKGVEICEKCLYVHVTKAGYFDGDTKSGGQYYCCNLVHNGDFHYIGSRLMQNNPIANKTFTIPLACPFQLEHAVV